MLLAERFWRSSKVLFQNSFAELSEGVPTRRSQRVLTLCCSSTSFAKCAEAYQSKLRRLRQEFNARKGLIRCGDSAFSSKTAKQCTVES